MKPALPSYLKGLAANRAKVTAALMREAFCAVRVRLRPNRGLPVGLAEQCYPPRSRSDYLIISRRPNKVRLRPTCAGLLHQPRITLALMGFDPGNIAQRANRTQTGSLCYATLTPSRGCCWFVDFSVGDLEASLHTPED
jgi:hypothetical protein